jgi:hypothetical protein
MSFPFLGKWGCYHLSTSPILSSLLLLRTSASEGRIVPPKLRVLLGPLAVHFVYPLPVPHQINVTKGTLKVNSRKKQNIGILQKLFQKIGFLLNLQKV